MFAGNKSVPFACAAIDLGSNTIRLLIARPAAGGLKMDVILTRREITRLASGLGEGGDLQAEAVSKSLEVLGKYAREIAGSGAAWTVAVGTGAVRDARDGRHFARLVARETGLELNIIDQGTEALLSLLGACRFFDPEKIAVLDIGGRSTELVWDSGGGRPRIHGLPLGVVGLRESFIAGDRPDPAKIKVLERHVRSLLETAGFPRRLPEGLILVGTGGTLTTLAALDQGLERYDRNKVQGYPLGLNRMRDLERRLSSLDEKGRASLAGMDPGRADIIIPGAILARILMERLGCREMVVSDADMLEGCVIAGLRGDPVLEKTPLDRLVPGARGVR